MDLDRYNRYVTIYMRVRERYSDEEWRNIEQLEIFEKIPRAIAIMQDRCDIYEFTPEGEIFRSYSE